RRRQPLRAGEPADDAAPNAPGLPMLVRQRALSPPKSPPVAGGPHLGGPFDSAGGPRRVLPPWPANFGRWLGPSGPPRARRARSANHAGLYPNRIPSGKGFRTPRPRAAGAPKGGP